MRQLAEILISFQKELAKELFIEKHVDDVRPKTSNSLCSHKMATDSSSRDWQETVYKKSPEISTSRRQVFEHWQVMIFSLQALERELLAKR